MNKVTDPGLDQFVVDGVQLTENKLGTGAYGSVEEVDIPGARVAAKKLHPELINLGSPQQVRKWVTDFVEECKLMSQLHHPHVVQFLGICYIPGSPLPILLMEKLQTSLDSLLETSPNIPQEVKVHLLTGTARGVVYLHNHNPPIAHRDLTARNILIDSGLTAKIADLGVARMVTVQPGHLAATMTRGPGNNLYMPPEAVEEEGATRYNTTIDIFSFGVVSLFTLTQTFPKDLKPAAYYDPATRKLVARSEIERRENYVKLIKTNLGLTHPLVKLTLDCLEFLSDHRPSAVEVLRQLEDIGRTIPQSCTETKLELIGDSVRNRELVVRKDEEIQRLQVEHQMQLSEKIAEIEHHQGVIVRLKTEKREQANEIERLRTLLKEMQRKRESSSQQMPSKHKYMHQPKVPGLSKTEHISPAPTASPVILTKAPTFKWKKFNRRPHDKKVFDQPVALNRDMYIRGWSCSTETVLHYIPGLDRWAELPPPPVDDFTIAALRGQLLVVGGVDKSTEKITSTLFNFNRRSQKWVQLYPSMPTALASPGVIGYQDHLIVVSGCNSELNRIPNVNILDTTCNKWLVAEPLPTADCYSTLLIEDTLYVVGECTRAVLKAHLPTLISGIEGVWESLLNTPCYWSSPVAFNNTLLTVGGSDKPRGGSLTTSIQMYDPDTTMWTVVGDLPEPMRYPRCIVINSALFVLGYSFVCTVYASRLAAV